MLNNYNIEISSNIFVSDNKPGVVMINEYLITINNDYNYTCIYRRGFLDNNLEMVTIDLPVKVNIKELLSLLTEVHDESYIRSSWDINKFKDSFAVDWSYDKNTYDVPINSDIGKKILDITLLNRYLDYSNKDIINLIET